MDTSKFYNRQSASFLRWCTRSIAVPQRMKKSEAGLATTVLLLYSCNRMFRFSVGRKEDY